MKNSSYIEPSGDGQASATAVDPLALELAAKYVQVKAALEKARATTHMRTRWHMYSEALEALHWIAQQGRR